MGLCDQLQWGRDQLIAEVALAVLASGDIILASMGPRSIDRGSVRAPDRPRVQRPASMGPRSIDRGSRLFRSTACGLNGLQWGRDQLIAEVGTRFVTVQWDKKLQWGRDQLIAEVIDQLTVQVQVQLLQWGRDQLIAEVCLSQ